MSREYKVGNRVRDALLGEGVVVDINICGCADWYLVLWDDTPPVQYNMGHNPSLWISNLDELGGEQIDA